LDLGEGLGSYLPWHTRVPNSHSWNLSTMTMCTSCPAPLTVASKIPPMRFHQDGQADWRCGKMVGLPSRRATGGGARYTPASSINPLPAVNRFQCYWNIINHANDLCTPTIAGRVRRNICGRGQDPQAPSRHPTQPCCIVCSLEVIF